MQREDEGLETRQIRKHVDRSRPVIVAMLFFWREVGTHNIPGTCTTQREGYGGGLHIEYSISFGNLEGSTNW